MKCRMMRHFIWAFTVAKVPVSEFHVYKGLNCSLFVIKRDCFWIPKLFYAEEVFATCNRSNSKTPYETPPIMVFTGCKLCHNRQYNLIIPPILFLPSLRLFSYVEAQ